MGVPTFVFTEKLMHEKKLLTPEFTSEIIQESNFVDSFLT
ncbi:hypothetical protein LBBP_01786 [Leptospira borgpetersenii serovar Ballum]|uniref:Uncharacterized protein n=1 Tax=Leptospira borgpetersenii serovar Ballum TaxID=280505 RepID=A0A0S2IRD1_LEPBO|nr:hypothetical protein LBBP_01786 [Leptospira borgpetersenii serovar Ballum]